MPDDMTGYEASELTQIEAIISGGGSDTAGPRQRPFFCPKRRT